MTYKFTVVDRSPKTGSFDFEEARRARLAQVEVERQLGINNDVRERHDALNQKAAGLRKGMTLDEVVLLLGLPQRVEIFVQQGEYLKQRVTSLKQVMADRVSGRRFVDGPVLRYSPYERDEFRPRYNALVRFLPYDRLYLQFDLDLKLQSWFWEIGQTEPEFEESQKAKQAR